MIAFIAVGAAVVLLLAAAVVRVLEAGRDDAWGPDADEPITFELTERGQVAADLPGLFALDEQAESWGPAS